MPDKPRFPDRILIALGYARRVCTYVYRETSKKEYPVLREMYL